MSAQIDYRLMSRKVTLDMHWNISYLLYHYQCSKVESSPSKRTDAVI